MSSSAASRAAAEIFSRALSRLDPERLTVAALDQLSVTGDVVLLALGKAAAGMTVGARSALGERIRSETVAVPAPQATLGPGWLEAAHPVPDRRSEVAGRALLAAARGAGPAATVLALVSGGGSALAAVPAPGLSLADKAGALARIYAAGADIGELNCVRKHLSAIKGGRLAAAAPGQVIALIVSDVVGDDLATVASGPTVADPTTFADAVEIVEARVGLASLPPSVRTHLLDGVAGRVEDTPATLGDRVHNHLVAGTRALVDAAVEAAAEVDLSARVLSAALTGDVARVAEEIAEAAGALAAGECLIGGGEATIALPRDPGRGGRCHHMALLVADRLRGAGDMAVLCAGSDGMDGNSGAAGAVVTGSTWDEIAARGGDPARALVRFDAATALEAAGASVVTGPTGINHADLIVVVRTARG